MMSTKSRGENEDMVRTVDCGDAKTQIKVSRVKRGEEVHISLRRWVNWEGRLVRTRGWLSFPVGAALDVAKQVVVCATLARAPRVSRDGLQESVEALFSKESTPLPTGRIARVLGLDGPGNRKALYRCLLALESKGWLTRQREGRLSMWSKSEGVNPWD